MAACTVQLVIFKNISSCQAVIRNYRCRGPVILPFKLRQYDNARPPGYLIKTKQKGNEESDTQTQHQYSPLSNYCE